MSSRTRAARLAGGSPTVADRPDAVVDRRFNRRRYDAAR
jgi:hypothetical protein